MSYRAKREREWTPGEDVTRTGTMGGGGTGLHNDNIAMDDVNN